MSEIEIRAVDAEELASFPATTFRAFGERPPEDATAFVAGLEPQRSFAAFHGGRIVGTAATLSLELTIPGGVSLPVGGLSWVGVLPTHRRRGILRRLMSRHLDDVVDRGESAAALFAAEANIYGRFGYGIATNAIDVEIDPRVASFARTPEDPGRIELVDRERAIMVLPDLHERIRRGHVGEVSRSADLWRAWFAEAERELGHAELFHAIHLDGDGRPDGYALHHIAESGWPQGIPGHKASARLAAVTSSVRLALWRYLLGLDLVRALSVTYVPLDDPIRWALSDPRQVRSTRHADGLWLRLVDVAAFLSARRYEVDVGMVIDVVDPGVEHVAGRYRLEAGPNGAACVRTDAEPDVVMEATTLGSVALGGMSLLALAAAGFAEERRRGALHELHAALRTSIEPRCATDF